jgi:hypothetical protein
MSQGNVFQNQEAHSLFNFFSKTLPIWNNVKDTAEGDKSKVKIQKAHALCLIHNKVHKHSEYLTQFALKQQR